MNNKPTIYAYAYCKETEESTANVFYSLEFITDVKIDKNKFYYTNVIMKTHGSLDFYFNECIECLNNKINNVVPFTDYVYQFQHEYPDGVNIRWLGIFPSKEDFTFYMIKNFDCIIDNDDDLYKSIQGATLYY